MLAKLHAKISAEKPFEIVFISSDKDESQFNEYYGQMPWMSLPFADRERKNKLSSKFKVQGIPSLVIIDENGKTITIDGRAAVTGNPDGFPWAPKPFKTLLGSVLRKPDGSTVPTSSIEGKNLALYFSAHWCPPCKGYTPVLAELYKAMKASGRDDFEFIFVSSDRDEGSFNGYHGEHPWLALPFNMRAEKEELSTRFGIEGIPSLVVVDSEGNVINKNARGATANDPTGAEFPWYPKKMEELSTTVESNGLSVNESPAVIVLCDGASEEVKAQCASTLLGVATELSACDPPDFIFFTASSFTGPVRQIKSMMKMDDIAEKPTIIILDVPDNGAFYVAKPDSITPESIKAAIASYSSKQLTRQQLGK